MTNARPSTLAAECPHRIFPHDNADYDYEGGLRQRRDLGRRGAHLAAFDEAGQNLFGDPDLVGEDAAQLHLDRMIAGDEIVDVAINEAVFSDGLEHEAFPFPRVFF